MKNIVRQLQTAITKAKIGTTDFCPHTLGQIHFPNNRIETFAPCHQCNLPLLAAKLDYLDGRTTPRRLQAAREAFALSAEKFPDQTEAARRAAIAEAFRVDASLL